MSEKNKTSTNSSYCHHIWEGFEKNPPRSSKTNSTKQTRLLPKRPESILAVTPPDAFGPNRVKKNYMTTVKELDL